MDLDDPKKFDDPKSSTIQNDFQLAVGTLAIQKSPVIMLSLSLSLLNNIYFSCSSQRWATTGGRPTRAGDEEQERSSSRHIQP